MSPTDIVRKSPCWQAPIPRRTLTLLALLVWTTTTGRAQQIDFVRDVRPIFQERCIACHGEKKQKGALRLDIGVEALRGGDEFAPNIIPGNAAESTLIHFVSGEDAELRMPPRGDLLSAKQIANVEAWIDEGAHWPKSADTAQLGDKLDHWSFQSVQPVDVPDTQSPSWPRTTLDHFVLARLELNGLPPAPQADRTTWLRRVSFDLVGLPPTPEQVIAFLADESAASHERVVDALLASNHFGERQAQHWFDVVRYAETHGFEVNTERPTAWPYRD